MQNLGSPATTLSSAIKISEEVSHYHDDPEMDPSFDSEANTAKKDTPFGSASQDSKIGELHEPYPIGQPFPEEFNEGLKHYTKDATDEEKAQLYIKFQGMAKLSNDPEDTLRNSFDYQDSNQSDTHSISSLQSNHDQPEQFEQLSADEEEMEQAGGKFTKNSEHRMVQEIGEIMAKDLLPETRDDFQIENTLRSSQTLELDIYSTAKDKQNI